MRSSTLLVVANEAEAAEICRAAVSPLDLRNRWPSLPLGDVGEDNLTWLGMGLGALIDEEQEEDSVAGEVLAQRGRYPRCTLVTRLIPEFIEVLSLLDAEAVRRTAREWCDPDFRRCGGRHAAKLVAGMAALARRARAEGKAMLLVW